MTSTMNHNRVCHFKLVLLGDTAVGKSCLVVRFVRDEFFEFQEPTIGGKACSMMMLLLSVVESIFLVLCRVLFWSCYCQYVATYISHHCIWILSKFGMFENRDLHGSTEDYYLVPREFSYCSRCRTRTKQSSATLYMVIDHNHDAMNKNQKLI